MRQHTENLFRSFKGKFIKIKTISNATYEGRVVDVTNDHVGLETAEKNSPQVYVFFSAIESVSVSDEQG